ncbi:MAG: SIS domain-containing protein [Bacilli bacterium]|nr:SIS domain-containing protein [Bacilli bacterium]
MKENKILEDLLQRYPQLSSQKENILKAFETLKGCFEKGGKLLVAGNGGSSADAEHIVGELMKGFKLKRELNDSFKKELLSIDPVRGKELAEKLQQGLPAISLINHQGLNTAFVNDVENGGLLTFAQQVNCYGKKGDVLLAISTSGNSKNVGYACVCAKAKGMKVIGLSGANGGYLNEISDVLIKAPSDEVYVIQELNLPIYHSICLMLEEYFFGK